MGRKFYLITLSVIIMLSLLLSLTGCAKAPAPAPTQAPKPAATTAPAVAAIPTAKPAASAATTAPAAAAAAATAKPAAAPTQAPAAKPAVSGTKMTLKLAHYFSVGDSRDVVLTRWAKQMEEGSQGQIKVDIFPSAQIASGRTMLASVSDGVAQVGSTATSYVEGEIPELVIFGMPPQPPAYTTQAMIKSILEVQDFADKKFAKYNAKLITSFAAPGNGVFFTKRPVTRLRDLEGKKMRTSGGAVDTRAYDLLGMKAVTLGASDQYTALQTGVVDGAMTTIDSYIAYSLYEVAPYIVWVTYRLPAPYLVMVNMDTWKKMSKEQQDLAMKAGADASKYSLELAASAESKLVAECNNKAKGSYTPTPEEASAWLGKASPVRKEWYDKVGKEAGEMLLGIIEKNTGVNYHNW